MRQVGLICKKDGLNANTKTRVLWAWDRAVTVGDFRMLRGPPRETGKSLLYNLWRWGMTFKRFVAGFLLNLDRKKTVLSSSRCQKTYKRSVAPPEECKLGEPVQRQLGSGKSNMCRERSQENSRKVLEKPTWELNIPTHLSHLKSSTCSRWYLDPWVPRGFPETTLNPHNISAFVSTAYWWIFGSEAVESDDDAWIIV